MARAVALLLLLAASAACTGPATAAPTPAIWWHSGDPPPASVATPTPYPDDQAINAPRAAPSTEGRFVELLRRNLRRRGIAAEVAAGPMIVVPSRDHPDAELAMEGEEAGTLAATWPQGAAMVLTNGGRWWVWDYGSTAPADALARQLTAQAPGRVVS